ncbi:hypothetical protein K490DRAFT_59333 [Saccharata proteae CBS 121410]|uniref:Uncharacterized protein n=1 Tax=Saccharata proteae CBS 121410 TaxID=1314787 RepID=A0A9P4LW34_9PEZI|nr:hypothetical protein K490DRAFT_59333 [Saccharata proteae CBS 121410]
MEHIIRLAPLATSSAFVMCSMGQQLAIPSFSHPSVPREGREVIFPRWFQSYTRIQYVSGSCFASSIILCAVNLATGPAKGVDQSVSKFWLAGMAFMLAHLYPFRWGLKLMGLQSNGYKNYTPADIAVSVTMSLTMIDSIREVNIGNDLDEDEDLQISMFFQLDPPDLQI